MWTLLWKHVSMIFRVEYGSLRSEDSESYNMKTKMLISNDYDEINT